MNTTSKLPTKLHRALSAVKNYLDRCPHGVSLDMATKKVSNLSGLNSKELEQLLDHLVERESVHVFRLSPKGSGDASKGRQYLKLKRFGEPSVPAGFDIWPVPDAPAETLDSKYQKQVDHIMSVMKKHMFDVCDSRQDSTMLEQATQQRALGTLNAPQQEGEQVGRAAASVTTVVKSAAQMRKEAEELLKQAEEVERESEQNDFFNKRLGPARLQVLQASNTIRTHLDGLIDGMAALEKAGEELKKLTA